MLEFAATFDALTGHPPFPWQRALYDDWFSQGKFPQSCNLPTGLGKTSVIAVWLIALANGKAVPRRLVYVVNRRTVVDQTTDEVEKYALLLAHNAPPVEIVLLDLSARLREMSSDPSRSPLALSTLRGQFADNREWSADPSRPAVICGTVDMIGSRLLFSGYGVGFKGKPLHAGFLGQDALLVHDEAHLEPAFQELLVAIEEEQKRCKDFAPLRVMELSATSRGGGEVFRLTDEERKPPKTIPPVPADPTQAERPIHHVWWRLHSKKAVELSEVADENKALVPKLVELAAEYKDADDKPAVLVFARSVKAVQEIAAGLKKKGVDEANIRTLTGTMRGLERDRLAATDLFQRFKKTIPVAERKATVYLVCTSAGEVGVDMSADHLVCDLSTLDSMAQRFGRVNRYGSGDATIDVVHPAAFVTKDAPFEAARERTLGLLKRLPPAAPGRHVANPAAMGELVEEAIREGTEGSPQLDRAEALRRYVLSAYAPPPTILPASDILFDAWSLTTVQDKLPGRPPVAEYLHGVEDEKQYETHFAWREEVDLFGDRVPAEQIAELLDAFPLKPHELLRESTFGKGRAYEQLDLIEGRKPDLRAWVVEPTGEVMVYTLKQLVALDERKNRRVPLAARTVVLPPAAGGLKQGLLNGEVRYAEGEQYDVAGRPPDKVSPLLRFQVETAGEGNTYQLVAPVTGFPTGFVADVTDTTRLPELNAALNKIPHPPVKPAFELDLASDSDDEDTVTGVTDYLIVKPIRRRKDRGDVPPQWPSLSGHLAGVRQQADAICDRLKLDAKLRQAVATAAGWHDIGKGRDVWQRGAGNTLSANAPVAKTLHGRAPENLNHFRHELGSMIDVSVLDHYAAEFRALDADQQAVALHLLATHHGRGRPHFPGPEVFDRERPQPITDWVAEAVPGRFAALQRKYGRWGLAYLESLLRAADALDSRRIEDTPTADTPDANDWPKRPSPPAWTRPLAEREPSIRVAVEPTNPGQFFASCGLLELADRLWPGAEGWFAADGREFRIACDGTLPKLLDALVAAQLEQLDPDDGATSPLRLPLPRPLVLDWWHDTRSGGKEFKSWAGQQKITAVARAMQAAIPRAAERGSQLFNYGELLPDPENPKKLVAPLYFDARRASGATNLDIGFSLDVQGIDSPTHPAVEFLCLIGLQRFRPAPAGDGYAYRLWVRPHPPATAAALACGAVPDAGVCGYLFRLLYRTKYLKGFLPAQPLRGE